MPLVTLIKGDGIGPETEAARRCIDATGAPIEWDIQEAGIDVMQTAGTPLPEATIESSAERHRPEGPHHHPCRHRLSLCQRPSPPAL